MVIKAMASNGPPFCDVGQAHHLQEILPHVRLYYKQFYYGLAYVPKRDKPNRKSWAVWSAQGEGAPLAGAENKKAVGRS